MKIFILTFLLSTSASASTTLECSGSVYSSSQFISGQCNNGSCYAYVQGHSDSFSGECSDRNVRFDANSYGNGGQISGQCNNGFLSIYVPGSYQDWSGHCSNGGNFTGHSNNPGSMINASCQPNGMFNAQVNGGYQNVSGECIGN